MERLTRKAREGFTLAELLIVVAIIAVLVAISIPIFSSQLEKSRENTDLANLRAAKAAAVTAYLSADAGDPLIGALFAASPSESKTVYYNAAQGKLVDGTTSTADGIGKGTTTQGGCTPTEFGNYTYNQYVAASGCRIQVTITKAGEVTVGFADASGNLVTGTAPAGG